MKKLSIRSRLLASNFATVLFVAGIGATGYLGVGALDQAMDAISGNGAAMKDQMAADQAHDALRADVLAALLAGADADAAAREAARRDTEQHLTQFRALLASMDKNVADPLLRQSMDAVRPDAEAYLRAVRAIVDAALLDPAAARARLPAFMEHFHRLERSMEALSNRIEAASDTVRRDGDDTVVRARRSIELGALLAALAAMTAGLLLARSISRPLHQAVGVADRIADGRLDGVLVCDDTDQTETGRLSAALARMQVSLQRIVGEVRGGTDAIAAAAGQIATGNMDLSARTESQAGALEETASSMEQLTAAVRQNAENARQANVLALSASNVAERGGATVSEVVRTMDAIEAAARRIGDITGVIEGIAFQTNILALNAAVEAARAGEQGRGFAVVAGEVRALAQRANAAAKEIKDLIEDSSREIARGGHLVGEAGTTMGEVVASVRRVTAIIGEISIASAEQEAGIGQVSRAVGEIDGATQQNAALVEEASAAAAALSDQADGLKRLVARFQLADAPPARLPRTLAALR